MQELYIITTHVGIYITIDNLPKDQENEIRIMLISNTSSDIKNYNGKIYIVKKEYISPEKLSEDNIYYYKTIKTIKTTKEQVTVFCKIGNYNNNHSFLYTNYQPFKGTGIAVNINDKISSISKTEAWTPLSSEIDSFNTFNYSINYEDMNLEPNKHSNRDYEDLNLGQSLFLNIIFWVIFTLIIKLAIAFLLKIPKKHFIILVNCLTQFALHFFSILSLFLDEPQLFKCLIIIFELLIIVFEFILYKKLIKDTPTKRLLLYSALANICSFLITPFINSLLFNCIFNGYI